MEGTLAMNETMQALMITEMGRRAELREIPRPAIDDDRALIRTRYSGVSAGTEMWIAHGRRKDYGEVPFVNGYQVVGEVVEAGGNVTSAARGDLVAGFVRGAHAQYAVAHRNYIHKLPSDSIAVAASLFVQPSVGANALNQADVKCGDGVLILGQGLIGQTTAQLARLRGAYVVASDVAPRRLDVSRRHCADWVLDASTAPASEQIKPRFPDGMDVVIESTGFEKLFDEAFTCARWEGKVIMEGFAPDKVSVTFALGHAKQLRLLFPVFIGTHASREGVLRLMASGKLDMQPLISDVVPWRRAAEVYNRLFTPDRDGFNGIVIDWGPDP
jgi:2-desacetyl-2-hydroxyethyl bacteriochlorophyllide A dehydrogenase